MALLISLNHMGTVTPVGSCVFSSTHIPHDMGPWASCAAMALSWERN